MHHELPEALPVDWLRSKRLPSSDGCYQSWIVLRNVGGYEPFAVHLACWADDDREWRYSSGVYTQDQKTAEAFWDSRNH